MYSGHWARPGDFAGEGPSWQQTGQCGFSPLLGEKVGQGVLGRELVSSHCVEGRTVPRTGGGIG